MPRSACRPIWSAMPAKIEDASLVFQVEPASRQGTPASRRRLRGLPGRPAARRAGNWLMGLAATALAALLAVGYWWPQPDEQRIAAGIYLRWMYADPSRCTAGITRLAWRCRRIGSVLKRRRCPRHEELPVGRPTWKCRLVDAEKNVRFAANGPHERGRPGRRRSCLARRSNRACS